MRSVVVGFLLSLILGLAVALTGLSGAKAAVLVELFTSQGCSSCPPADRLLIELAAREDLEIIPLSFHVDYWNYIGWTDPFSSRAWSDRQRRYARGFGGNRIYTPQMIVNGRWEGVGSDREEVSRLLARASAEPRVAEIRVSAEPLTGDRLRVVVDTPWLDPGLELGRLSAWVAVVESALATPVSRGENADKTLRNDRVVRRLERLSAMEPIGNGASAYLDLTLEPGWHRAQLGVVTFLQDTESLRIHATAEHSLAGTQKATAARN